MSNKKCYICDKPLSNEEIFVLDCDDESFDLCEQHYKASNRLFAHIEKRKEELKDKVCCKNYDTNCEFDGVWFCQNPDCKTKVFTSTLPGSHPSGCPKIDKWNSKKAEKEG